MFFFIFTIFAWLIFGFLAGYSEFELNYFTAYLVQSKKSQTALLPELILNFRLSNKDSMQARNLKKQQTLIYLDV
jgi:hypothetical protein